MAKQPALRLAPLLLAAGLLPAGCGSSAEPPGFAWFEQGPLPQDRLTAAAGEALELVPTWLRTDVLDSLARRPAGVQDAVAGLIVSAEPRLRDEIAFVAAHVGLGELRFGPFEIELLRHNARLIYERAEELAYVELVEHGDAAAGGDYHTSARYRLEDGWVEIDRGIYYWYVVHPRLEDERPVYLDPATNTTSPPPQGRFWREDLYAAADALCPNADRCPADPFADGVACPRLADLLADERFLWRGRQDDCADNGAVGAVCRWVNASMCFGAGAERPVQALRIYQLHRGNCGEYADLTSAAARAALIPTGNVAAYVNDHTWNRFYDGAWHQLEPVNRMVDSAGAYDRDGADGAGWWWLAGAYTARGDGSLVGVTADYSGLTARLEAEVTDSTGRPVEGAQVVAGGDRLGFVAVASGLTDAAGRVALTLGDRQSFQAIAFGELGQSPAGGPEEVVALSEPDAVYPFRASLPGALPLLELQPAPPPRPGDYRLRVTVAGGRRFVVGRSVVHNMEYVEARSGAAGRVLLLDAANRARLLAGEPFAAHPLDRQVAAELELELADPTGWALVVDHSAALGLASWERVRIELRRGDELLLEREEAVYLQPGERRILGLERLPEP
jgi:hypothetical protein